MLNDHIVFLDLETTGGSAIYDRIIEIGLVEVDRGRFVEEWSTLVNPGRHIPQGIQTLTGITDEMAAGAPSFEELSAALASRLEGKVLAAHNARFDYGFLKSEFRRAGVSYTAPVLCTVKLSRRLFPQYPRHNLDALIMRHSIFCLDRHRALGDAQVLWELAQIWRREPGEEMLNDVCRELLRRPTVPAGLPEDIFDTLPESPGVYVFHGENDRALYVGKSTNIRSRVMAHFSGDAPAGKDMQISEIKRVDCIETAGELGAWIQESRLVKKLAPAYNRRARSASEVFAWRWRPEAPQSPPELLSAEEVGNSEFETLYGIFRSRASARTALRELSKAYGLCLALMGLERRADEGPCLAYASKDCRGACVGAEPPISHAMRVVQALSGLRVKRWPYPGRVGVRERDPDGYRTELHVVDRWRYLGTVKSEADLDELSTSSQAPFDPDTYKMLARFLKSPPRSCDIVALPRSDVASDRAGATEESPRYPFLR